MKAFWIDTPNARIVEIDYNGDWRTIAPEWLKCDVFTCVEINELHDAVMVDDEGLINGNPHGWFILDTYEQPLKGYGLVLGTDITTGDTAPAKVSLPELVSKIRFPIEVNEALIDKEIHVTRLFDQD